MVHRRDVSDGVCLEGREPLLPVAEKRRTSVLYPPDDGQTLRLNDMCTRSVVSPCAICFPSAPGQSSCFYLVLFLSWAESVINNVLPLGIMMVWDMASLLK